MAKSAAEDKSAIPVTVSFRPTQVEFLERAAKAAGKVRTVFLRATMLAAAAKQLGEDAPEAEPFDLGAQSDISRAAKQAGMPVRQFVREMASKALEQGLTASAPAGKIMSTRDRIAKRKAKASGKKYRVGKKPAKR